MAEITLLKAMLNHCKLDKENLTEFRAGLAALTPEDKAWFRAQFAKEFGYTIVDGAAVK